MELVYDEKNHVWKKKEAPYAVLEVPTEEDWDNLKKAVSLRNKLSAIGLPSGDIFSWAKKVETAMKQHIDFGKKKEEKP